MLEGVPSIAMAVRVIRKGTSEGGVAAAQSAIKLAQRYVTNILDSPQNPRPRRIKTANRVFHQIIGQFEGGRELMEALGFSAIKNGTVYELRCMSGSPVYASTRSDYCSDTNKSCPTFLALDPATKDFLLGRMDDLRTSTAALASLSMKGGSIQTLMPDSGLTRTRVTDTVSNRIATAKTRLLSSSQQHTRNPKKSFMPKKNKKIKGKTPLSGSPAKLPPSCSSSKKLHHYLKCKTDDDIKHNKTTTTMAIAELTGAPITKQIQCIETVLVYLENILKGPHHSLYRVINTANTAFVRKVSSVPGGIALLIAAGFRENDYRMLIFPKDGNLEELGSSKVELDAALPMLKARAVSNQIAAAFGAATTEPTLSSTNIKGSIMNVHHDQSGQSTKKDDTSSLVIPHNEIVTAPEIVAAKYNRKIPDQSGLRRLKEKKVVQSKTLSVKSGKHTQRRRKLRTMTTTLSAPSSPHSTQLCINQQLGKQRCRPGNTVKVRGRSEHAEEGVIIAVQDGICPILDLEQTLSHAHKAGETVEIFQHRAQGIAEGKTTSCRIWQCQCILDSIVSLAAEKGEKLMAMH